MKRSAISIAAVGLLCACAPRTAPPVVAPAQSLDARTTLSYLQSAAAADLLEVQLAEIAFQRAQNPSVRQFAQSMLNDHSQLGGQAASVAQAAGGVLSPAILSPQQMALVSQLQNATASDFDSAYRNIEVMTHLQNIDLHQGYLSTATNQAVRSYAQSALTTAQNHMYQAQSLAIVPPPAFRPPSTRRVGERG